MPGGGDHQRSPGALDALNKAIELAPRSPNNAVLPLLLRMNGAAGGDYLVPKGGMRAIAASLVSAAQAAGAQIRTSSPVKRIIIEGGENGERATGVGMYYDNGLNSSAANSRASEDSMARDSPRAAPADVQVEVVAEGATASNA